MFVCNIADITVKNDIITILIPPVHQPVIHAFPDLNLSNPVNIICIFLIIILSRKSNNTVLTEQKNKTG